MLLFHFELGRVFRAGFVGVDIFFVISGFLIGSILRTQFSEGTFSAAAFYTRRIRRLAPGLLATVALTLAVGSLILTPVEMKNLGDEAVAAQLYVSNIYYWRFLSYFGLQAQQSLLLHTWSLGVEEQFYLVFPLALWVVFRWRGNVALFLILVGVASFGINAVTVYWKPEATFYLLPTRAWEFAWGALTPEVIAWTRKRRVPASAAALTGLAGLLCTLAFYNENVAFPGLFAALPVGSTVALLVAGEDSRGLYTRAISTRVPVYLGRISYELYLVHWPIRVFAPMLLFQYSVIQRIACFLICIPLAACIYHALSVPIRRATLLVRRRNLVAAYAAGTLGTVAIAAAAVVSHGFPNRLSRRMQQLAASASDENLAYRLCEGHPIGTCRSGATDRAPSWLIYGDSHADALAGPFDSLLREHRLGAYFAFQSGCLPVLRSGDSNCREFNEEAFKFLEAHPEIRTVVLIATWRQPLEPAYRDLTGTPVSGQVALDAFQKSLSITIERHQAAGRQVIIWLPVPGALKNVPGTLVRNALLGRNWEIRYSGRAYERTFAFLGDDLDREKGLVLIRPAPYICGSGMCDILHDGRPLYHDDAHPAASQAPFFTHILDSELKGVVGGARGP